MQIPPQTAINGLLLSDIPAQLQLTQLEAAVVAQRILFMRLVALPRGHQRAIHGAVVNVPTNVSSTVTVVPLTLVKVGLIPLKLKRRLRYKGYMLQQFVRPHAVLRAVEWLTQNNPLYCCISVDHNWNQSCFDEDPDTWTAMTGNGANTDQSDHVVEPQPASHNGVTTRAKAKQQRQGSAATVTWSDRVLRVRQAMTIMT